MNTAVTLHDAGGSFRESSQTQVQYDGNLAIQDSQRNALLRWPMPFNFNTHPHFNQ